MAPSPHRLPVRRVKWNDVKAYAVSGNDLVLWLLNYRFASARSDAADMARQLVKMGALVPLFKVTNAAKTFSMENTALYVHRGLSCYQERGLNAMAVWGGKERPLASVLNDIGDAFADLLKTAVSVDGHWVEYSKVRGSQPWRTILPLLTELAHAKDETHLDEKFKLAAWINLYNVLIFHAKLVFAHPTDLVKRSRFFNDAAYVIAGKKITSVELEHAVLRRKMLDNDHRISWKLEKKDPRMHFVLNCGAQSCPPLLALNQHRVEDMLQQATSNFIENNCHVDLIEKKVVLSRLWKWFRADFTPASTTDIDLIKWIMAHAAPKKKEELVELLTADFKIKFDVYNWADNGDENAKPDVRFMLIYDRSFASNA